MKRSDLAASCTAATFLLVWLASAAGQDTVTVAGSTGGRTRITGRVLDYTGHQLRLQHADGREQTFAAEKVLSVETLSCREQDAADALLKNGRFQEALALYRKALENESRRWVRREIIAGVVWCYRGLERPEEAGEAFLLLIRSDPHTLHFDCIPLEWMPRQPSATVEQAARRWLRRDEPAAGLLGASYLLTTDARATALAKLRGLAVESDPPVARLASAQVWRTAVATADPQQIDAWQRTIEDIPPPLAAGPYYVLGQARARQAQWEQAALALLRTAILHPRQRRLAAQSLLEAARALEHLDRPGKASRLYRELLRSYPEQTRVVAEARSRMEAIANNESY